MAIELCVIKLQKPLFVDIQEQGEYFQCGLLAPVTKNVYLLKIYIGAKNLYWQDNLSP